MKSDAFRKMKEFLTSEGFDIFEYPRGCFDIAAKRKRLLLLKILTNIDSFQREQARDLKILSKFLDSNCFVLGKRTRKEKLADSVVYERFGIPAMTPETFTSVINGDYPQKFRTRGGTFGRLNPEDVRKYRKRKSLTQAELAEEIGTSQKSISEYESGKERAIIDMVEALEELLGEDIKKEINPFDIEPFVEKRRKENELCRRLTDLGFNAGSVERAPSKILAKGKTTILSRAIRKKGGEKELESLASFSQVSGAEAFVITYEETRTETLPPVNMRELKEVESSQELLSLVREKKQLLD